MNPDDELDFSGWICGIPPHMCQALLQQGIKPWDDDAWSALGVLYDFEWD